MAIQELVPKISAQLNYDDNIVFSRNNPRSDWIYEMWPSLSWKYRTERDILAVTARLHGQKYSSENELNTLDQDYRLYALRDIFWDTTLSLKARYALDTTLDEEFTEEGVLLNRQDRTVYSVTPGVKWRATERSTWDFSVPIYSVNYHGTSYNTAYYYDGSGNTDYNTAYLVLNYSYLLDDEKTSLLTQGSAGMFDYENGNSRTYELMGGVSHAFTERLTAQLMGGVNFTHSHTNKEKYRIYLHKILVQEETSSNDAGWVGLAEVRWRWDRGYWDMHFGRTVLASGYGEMLKRDRFTVGTSCSVTDRLRFTGRFSVTSSKSQGSKNYEDEVTYDINPGLVYRLFEHIDVSTYYHYSFLKYKGGSDTASRNRFMIRLDYTGFRFGM